MGDRPVRIGCSAGFWGDTLAAASQLVREGNIDYLVSDYLSEVTMSILARMRMRDPKAGYVPDFLEALDGLLPEIVDRNIRVITNAGGINPSACRDALLEMASEAGVKLSVAIVNGDDLMPRVPELRELDVRELDTGEALPERMASINVYLGATPIAAALDEGAQVVIAGRCVDSAPALGALMHEFGWQETDYDQLAGGSLAGHVIECGAQATGGLYTDWEDVPGWENMGFPVVTCFEDGRFEVSKPPGTGGLISVASISEQVVYEIGDPANYQLPDVSCDFSNLLLTQVDDGCVAITGAAGRSPNDHYKASATFVDGFRCIATFMLAGSEANLKARRVAESILLRCRRLLLQHDLKDFSETSIEIIGAEDSYGANARVGNVREVIAKIGVRHDSRAALDFFAREVIPAGTAMAQGLTGVFGGRPKVTPVVRLFSFLLKHSYVPVTVDIGDRLVEVEPAKTIDQPPYASASDIANTSEPDFADVDLLTVPLRVLAHGRSGDKGNHANIGVIARAPAYLPLLRSQLTAECVASYFAHYLKGEVVRYEWPGLNAFNFVLRDVLGGGGMASLRYDPQGKTYAQILLDLPIEIPAAWLESDKDLASRVNTL
jgi:hypothetical protein